MAEPRWPAGDHRRRDSPDPAQPELRPFQTGDLAMSLGTILIIVLILMLLGAIPSWPYSAGWGYGPSGLLGTVLIVVLVLVLLGRL
jgi:hypothetical protein